MLSSKTKRELKIDQRQILIDSIEIGIPSPQQILTWGERLLPNGKKVGVIKNSKTVNYKRFTPFRDGLFCERIFGPVTSFVCACGKKQPHSKVAFCEKCEVEYIDQRSRRYRLGYISLLSPVTHIWYLKGRPSYLSLFLGKRKKTIVALAYCNAYLIEHGHGHDISQKNDNVKTSYAHGDIWPKNKVVELKENEISRQQKLGFLTEAYKYKHKASYKARFSSGSFQKQEPFYNVGTKHPLADKRRLCMQDHPSFLQRPESNDIEQNSYLSFPASYATYFYARQHTLPFLPSFVSHFYLRDALLSFLYSLPAYQDFPLMEYCHTKRWEPLRDVHKFMAHRTVDNLKNDAPCVRTCNHSLQSFVSPDALSLDLPGFVPTPNFLPLKEGQGAKARHGYGQLQGYDKQLKEEDLHVSENSREDIPTKSWQTNLPQRGCTFVTRAPKVLGQSRCTNKPRARAPKVLGQGLHLCCPSTGSPSGQGARARTKICKCTFLRAPKGGKTGQKGVTKGGARAPKVQKVQGARLASNLAKQHVFQDFACTARTSNRFFLLSKKEHEQRSSSQAPLYNSCRAVFFFNKTVFCLQKLGGRFKVNLHKHVGDWSGLQRKIVNRRCKKGGKSFLSRLRLGKKMCTKQEGETVHIKSIALAPLLPEHLLCPFGARTGTHEIHSFEGLRGYKTDLTPNKSDFFTCAKRSRALASPLHQRCTPVRAPKGQSRCSGKGCTFVALTNLRFVKPALPLWGTHGHARRFARAPSLFPYHSQNGQNGSAPAYKPLPAPFKTEQCPGIWGVRGAASSKASQTKNGFVTGCKKIGLHLWSPLQISPFGGEDLQGGYKSPPSGEKICTGKGKSEALLNGALNRDCNRLSNGVASCSRQSEVQNQKTKRCKHLKNALCTKRRFVQRGAYLADNERKATLPEENNRSLLSGLELTAIREILSYTGGGALQQLLQQFNQHDLCKFLFAEAQILRVFYETLISTGLAFGQTGYSSLTSYKSPKKAEHCSPAVQGMHVRAQKGQQRERFAHASLPVLAPLGHGTYKSPPLGLHQRCTKICVPLFAPFCVPKRGNKGALTSPLWGCTKGARRFVSAPTLPLWGTQGKACTYFAPLGHASKRCSLTKQPQKFCQQSNETKGGSLAKQDRAKQSFACTFCTKGVPARAYKYKASLACVRALRAVPLCCPSTFFAPLGHARARKASKKICTASLVLKNKISPFFQAQNLLPYKSSYKAKRSLRFVRRFACTFEARSRARSKGLQISPKGVASKVHEELYDKRRVKLQIKQDDSSFINEKNRRNAQFGNKAISNKTQLCNNAHPVFGIDSAVVQNEVRHDTLSCVPCVPQRGKVGAHKSSSRARLCNCKPLLLDKDMDKGISQSFSAIPTGGEDLYDHFQNKSTDLQKKQILRLSRRIYKVARRLKITQLLSRNHRKPEWMILSHLPVLPPDLRPILQMSEKVIVASDLNVMYQRVIYRNNRHLRVRFIDFHLVTAIQRLVQDAVDRLIENGKGGSKPYYTQGGRPLKSLSDILKGKKGRFRLNLLGKRVDFSGRSVIVVSPQCQIHECGLPKAIALELYHYFLLRQLIVKKHCASIVTAKKMIKSKSSLMWEILRELMYHHPVLLNRAPTLHRLGIQAFQPKLVLGNAILLHPLVCSGFNADFDGDQMGVHLPLSFAARAESWDLLWSRNNLLSPATGQPMLVPTQDMVLGFYYITAQALQNKAVGVTGTFAKRSRSFVKTPETSLSVKQPRFVKNQDVNLASLKTNRFLNLKDITTTLQTGRIKLHQPVWLHWSGKIENEEGFQKPVELRVHGFGAQQSVYEKYISSNFFTRTRVKVENNSCSYKQERPLFVPSSNSKASLPPFCVPCVPQKETKGAKRGNKGACTFVALTNLRFVKPSLPLWGTHGHARQTWDPVFTLQSCILAGYEHFSSRGTENNAFFISTELEAYYVRTTAGRVLMNNLIKD